jgi:hypothetical protein
VHSGCPTFQPSSKRQYQLTENLVMKLTRSSYDINTNVHHIILPSIRNIRTYVNTGSGIAAKGTGASMFCFFTNYQYFLRNPNIAYVKWHILSDNLQKILILASLRPLYSYSHESTHTLTDRCLFSQMSDILFSSHVNMINCRIKFTLKCCEINDNKNINIQETPALEFHGIRPIC